jgi:hypothetical protein
VMRSRLEMTLLHRPCSREECPTQLKLRELVLIERIS